MARPLLGSPTLTRGFGAKADLLLAPLGPWVLPTVMFATALALRVGVQWLVGFYSDPLRWEYDLIARNIVEGRGYTYDFLGTEWRTFGLPAFPLLDAGLYVLSGGTDRFVAIGVTLAALSAGTAALATVIAERLAGRLAALLAGLAIAFHPALVLYAAEIQELSLQTFVLAITLLAFLAELERPTTKTLLAATVAAAAAVFVRPTYGAFVVAGLGVIVARRPLAFRRALAVVAAITLVTTPWSVRTARELGVVAAPVGPYSCVTLWMGNNAYSSGSTIATDGRSWWALQPSERQAAVWGRSEVDQGRFFCEDAATFVTADPVRTFRWWMTKWSWYWWVSPQAGQFYPSAGLRIYLGLWAVAAALAVVGAISLWRRSRAWDLAMILAAILPISLAQSFAYVDGRHRMEVEWAIVVLATVGITTLLRRRSAAQRPASAARAGT